jgi:UDP-N-acetylglucosamine--N-acetylmuramyl-(pentapeptide) pyrophosphoryl-undecaprenol N-acetylglucosamine transferase
MRILVAAGASGGHIFPAASFIETLKDKNIQTRFILPKRSIKIQIRDFACEVNYISVSPIKLSIGFKNLFSVLNLLKGFSESVFILAKFRPDIVVGFGSLVCVPVLLSSWMFKIKTIIHEQNVIPGRATRFLAVFVDRVAISFSKTKDYLKIPESKIVFTGNPLRKDLKRCDKPKALDFFGFKEDKFTILVMGGSQGSHRINAGFLKAVSSIPSRSILQIIHLTGLQDYVFLRERYKDLDIKVKLFSFLEEMQFAYSIADLVLSRAGATTLAEIMSFRLPAIITPYPFAYKHQLANAKVLESLGSAIIINDEELETDRLRQLIQELINNPDKIKQMRYSYDSISLYPANELLVNEALSLLYSAI